MDDLKLYAKNEKGLESLVQTVGIFCDDIGMKFGISKCATLALKKGKITNFDGISLSVWELQGVKEAVKLTNLGLENYVKESRKTLLIAARSVDIDLIGPIRETTIKLRSKRRRKEQFFWEKKKCCMAILCN